MKFGKSILVLLIASILAGHPPPPGRRPGPPPPPLGGPPPPGGPEGVRRKLAEVRPTGDVTNKILALARVYLERSERNESGSPFAATRHLAAADALVHAAEHQQHIPEKTGPPPPDRSELARHLDRVYFRLQQADYFVKQSADPNATTIASFARQYYQDALRASDLPDPRVTDGCAKSAEDLIRALENLAQATAPVPISPKRPVVNR